MAKHKRLLDSKLFHSTFGAIIKIKYLEFMKLLINGENREFTQELNLHALLQNLDIQSGKKGLALCLNMEVIPQQNWNTTALSDGDRVEIVIAAPGG